MPFAVSESSGSSVARPRMGLTVDCFPAGPRWKGLAGFLEFCVPFGAGGIEGPLDAHEPAYLKKLRERAEQLGMYVELWATLPGGDDTSAFERTVISAKQIGASCLRAFCLGGRRYEQFNTLEEWRQFVARSRASLARALPILEKHKVVLGLENHKDWTLEEMAGLMKEFDSEYLGVCLDTGNNIALLDDTRELVDALSPYTVSTHIKDIAGQEYEDGFLNVEVPLGQGMVDVKYVVEKIRKERPKVNFTLEMYTRSPLKIPGFTPKYWVTFPDRTGRDLARTLRTIRSHPPKGPLPGVQGLDPEARRALEDENVRRSLAYAREQLGL